jgi:hypothetical protein
MVGYKTWLGFTRYLRIVAVQCGATTEEIRGESQTVLPSSDKPILTAIARRVRTSKIHRNEQYTQYTQTAELAVTAADPQPNHPAAANGITTSIK